MFFDLGEKVQGGICGDGIDFGRGEVIEFSQFGNDEGDVFGFVAFAAEGDGGEEGGVGFGDEGGEGQFG